MENIKINPFYKLFETQKAHQWEVGNSTYKMRIEKLNELKIAVTVKFKTQIREALYADLKKPYIETDLTEIYPIVGAIKFVKSNLKSWMKSQHVATPMSLLGAASWYTYEPKGVCLLISPWNFPLNLTFGPLVSAIAAGNAIIIKPSEMTPHTSRVMAEIIAEIFTPNEVALVEGDSKVAEDLLKLPFNHTFFTGSPRVGKIVMTAAAQHLSSVTLELGGKSPTIIDDTTALKSTVKRIVWGKFVNNGQTCIAPDYVLIKDTILREFIAALKIQIEANYSKTPKSSKDLARIVNDAHYERLAGYIEQAKSNGGVVEIGGETDAEERYVSPTVLSSMSDSDDVMLEEIFGPILPIKTYRTIEDAVAFVNSKEKPLALYVYSKSKKNINYIMRNTRAGTTCVNNNVIQYSNSNLPFGGSNNSGIGKANGLFGFQEFSNMRSVVKQYTFGPIDLLQPPYTAWKQKLVDFTLKWF